MKKYIISLLICLFVSPVFAGTTIIKKKVASGPPITFYFNANSATTDQTPTIGSGTVTIGTSVATVTGAVGNGLTGSGVGWSAGRISIPTSGNMSMGQGTIGFYMNNSANMGATIVSAEGIAYDVFGLSYAYESAYSFYYQGSSVLFGISTASTHFVELAFDDAGNRMSVRVDGGSWEVNNSVGGTLTSAATLVFLNNSGLGFGGWMDQIMISSDYQADLYSVRNNTSF